LKKREELGERKKKEEKREENMKKERKEGKYPYFVSLFNIHM